MVPGSAARYGARSMAPSRPRRTAIRRAFPILVLVTAAVAASLTTGPNLSAPPAAGAAASARPVLVRTEPESIHEPAPDVVVAAVSPIGLRPREPDGPSATSATRIALQARLDGIRRKYAMPGVSVTIIFPDGTRWVGTSGFADLEAGTAVTPDTAFAIASITKTFTAALIMALAEDDRIILDAQVRAYLPDLPIDPAITVRQLLDHTSGLRDYFFHPRIDKLLLANPARRWNEAQALRYMGKPYFKPGRGWHYSNTNYLVLGMLAERVAKVPLDLQLRQRFFEPLGLRHAFYQPTEVPAGPVARGYRFESAEPAATAIDLSDGSPIVPFTSVVTAAAGAGGIAATSSDIARWARALYGGGVLGADSVREMLDDVVRTQGYRPTVPYGLGVQLVDLGGRSSLGHSGRLLGFRSVVRWLPDEGIAIAVLTNQSRTDPGIVARALLKIALHPTASCPCVRAR